MIRSRAFRALAGLLTLLAPLVLVQACGGDDGSPSGPEGPEDTVGPDGGTLSFQNGGVVLVFPAGAVSSDLTVTVQLGGGPADDFLVGGSDRDLGPDGTQFSQPVGLTLGYDPGQLPAGVREQELGLYKAVSGGWEEVQGSTVDAGSNTVSGSINSFSVYGVLGPHVAGVDVTPAELAVDLGATGQLTAHPKSADGLELLDREVTWSSGDEAVATVDADGLVTGQGEGATTVTATSEGAQGSSTVTVRIPVASVTVDPAEAQIGVGGSVALTATPRDANGDALERDVGWASSDDAVATVDDEGLVTGMAEGSATVTATSEGVEGTAAITVQNTVASVVVTTPVLGVVSGGTVQMSGKALDAGDNELQGETLAWSSSDESVATVDGDGLVTTLAPGAVTITASVDGIEGTADLTSTIDWTQWAGTWAGSWTNTTYASTGAINATLTIDVDNLKATLILDVDGFVFGTSDPPPMTIVGTLKAETMMVDYTSPSHGPVQFDLAPGSFDLSSVSVPTSGIDAWDYSGTNSASSHTADFTVYFTGGGTAVGTVTVTKQ